MKKIDFIIVGQGLAGSILTLELLKHGKSVLVVDNAEMSLSSRTSGGIYNPVVFKRLTQSWMADKTLPAMLEFFKEVEKLLNIKLIHPIKIAHVIGSEPEELLWKKKAANALSDFIEAEIHAPENEYAFLKTKYGFVTQAGFIDMPVFLGSTRKYIEQQGALLNETFTYEDIVIHEDEVQYKDVVCSNIIFCEGHLTRFNPYFNTIKFKPAKGDMLTIYCEELKTTSIVTKDFFILPLPEEHCFKVGATYDWQDLTDNINEEAKQTLLKKLDALIPYSYKVINHQAGVRPATLDRRPVMGNHPTYKNLHVFNGFGTKGILLAPYFAKHFCSFMFLNQELFSNVDVKRFYE
ncbi:MAG TPA: FAD-dependent oxidoreductase [Bacteroidia bacterium]